MCVRELARLREVEIFFVKSQINNKAAEPTWDFHSLKLFFFSEPSGPRAHTRAQNVLWRHRQVVLSSIEMFLERFKFAAIEWLEYFSRWWRLFRSWVKIPSHGRRNFNSFSLNFIQVLAHLALKMEKINNYLLIISSSNWISEGLLFNDYWFLKFFSSKLIHLILTAVYVIFNFMS